MTTWELAEKPRRKGRQFAVVIHQHSDAFLTRLVYYGKKPYGSLGYVASEITNTKDYAHKIGKLMLKALKHGNYDRVIDEDLKSEEAWRKMGRVI